MLTDNQVNQVFFTQNNSLSTATFKIKDIYVIAVVLSSHLVSSPTVGELTVTDNHQKLYMEDKKKKKRQEKRLFIVFSNIRKKNLMPWLRLVVWVNYLRSWRIKAFRIILLCMMTKNVNCSTSYLHQNPQKSTVTLHSQLNYPPWRANTYFSSLLIKRIQGLWSIWLSKQVRCQVRPWAWQGVYSPSRCISILSLQMEPQCQGAAHNR